MTAAMSNGPLSCIWQPKRKKNIAIIILVDCHLCPPKKNTLQLYNKKKWVHITYGHLTEYVFNMIILQLYNQRKRKSFTTVTVILIWIKK